MKISRANKFILFFLLYEIIISLILNQVLNKNNACDLILSQIISLGIPVLILFILNKKQDLILTKVIKIKNLCYLILLALYIQPVMTFFSVLSEYFCTNPTQNLSSLLKNSFWKLILLTAIMPALCEEIIFRGIFLGIYLKQKIDIKKILFVNGLVFAAMHLNLQQFIYALAMGVIFAFIVFITRSVWASVIMHFVFNFTQVTLGYLQSREIIRSYKISHGRLLIAFIIALIFIVPCYFLLKLILKSNNDFDLNEFNSQERVLTWELVLYLIICFAIMLHI